MTRPWVRLVLVFAGVAAIAAAGFVVWSSETRDRAAASSFALAADTGRRALADAADLRAAQQAYVAVGQGADFWFARASSLTDDLEEILGIFRGHLSSPEALASADTAANTLRDFRQADKRAREYTRAGQLPQASDVIFADGFDLTKKVAASITAAISAENVAFDAAVAQRRRGEAIALAAAAGVASLALLLLVPGGSSAQQEGPVRLGIEPAVAVSRETLDDLNDFGLVVRRTAATPEAPSIDLAGMAAICSDLSRVVDTRAIPALLERAAGILDAAGIVLWIADPDGRELSPIVVHGYAPQMASRLGTIPREAANVTASAYRTSLLQTVKGDAVANGAVAAPLLGAGGCLGVMAIEMKNGGEQREPLLAAATIIAAQISTLVGPPSMRTRAEAAG